MSEAEQLSDLDRYGVVLLLDELRLPVGSKNRNRTAIRPAWNLAEIRYDRVERGDKQRSRLDELIEPWRCPEPTVSVRKRGGALPISTGNQHDPTQRVEARREAPCCRRKANSHPPATQRAGAGGIRQGGGSGRHRQSRIG